MMKIYACAIIASQVIETTGKTTVRSGVMSCAFLASNKDEATGKGMRTALKEFPDCTDHTVSVCEVPAEWYQLAEAQP